MLPKLSDTVTPVKEVTPKALRALGLQSVYSPFLVWLFTLILSWRIARLIRKDALFGLPWAKAIGKTNLQERWFYIPPRKDLTARTRIELSGPKGSISWLREE